MGTYLEILELIIMIAQLVISYLDYKRSQTSKNPETSTLSKKRKATWEHLEIN